MEQLDVLCDSAKNFPLNVADGNGLTYQHESIFSKLNEQEKRLFCQENKAVIDILDHGPDRRGKTPNQRRVHGSITQL